jgi:hypothetical protein
MYGIDWGLKFQIKNIAQSAYACQRGTFSDILSIKIHFQKDLFGGFFLYLLIE